MAFLAQRGVPDHLILHILELAGPESVQNVCATHPDSIELIHRVQCDFPETWTRMWYHDYPLPIEALVGVKSVIVSGSVVRGDREEVGEGVNDDISTVQLPPTLRTLTVRNMRGTAFVHQLDLRHLCPGLRKVGIRCCHGLETLPASFFPDKLQELEVFYCMNLTWLSTLPPELCKLSVCLAYSALAGKRTS